jgi:putative hydrolase of HD superfamily
MEILISGEGMKTKAPNPISRLQGSQSPIIHAYFEFAHLKQLYRQGWLARGVPEKSCESVAEHTFGVAVTAMLLADAYFPNLDMLKILRMALIHDFGEIYAGDIIPGDQITSEEKHTLEKEAISQIFKGLPNGENYLSLWLEFESGISPEARFVRQIDKLEMALQASVYEHLSFGKLPEFYRSAGQEISTAELQTILQELEASKT